MFPKDTAKSPSSANRGMLSELVGAKGFEPSTTPTPRECATGLRYAPISESFSSMICKALRISTNISPIH